jgi:hypothetical protein
MTLTYKILDPLSDYDKLADLMWFYYLEESAKLKTVYPLSAIWQLIESNLVLFKESNNVPYGDYVISGAFNNDELVGFAIGRKLNHYWKILTHVIPQWVLVLIYLKNKEWETPLERLHELLLPITSLMEEQKYYEWYKVSKFSRKVTINTLDNYLETVYSKIINSTRYIVSVELVINNSLELALVEGIYRRLFPTKIHDDTRLVLLKHQYKNSLRNLQL